MVAVNKEKIIKNAQAYVGQGKLDRAVKEYEKLLEQDPRDPTLLNTIGDLSLSLNRTPIAIEYFKRAAQKYIDEAYFGRGLAVYRKIVRADPRNLENSEVLADLFMKEGIQSDAKKLYAEIGRAYLQSENYPKAYQVFKKLGDLTLDDAAIHIKLAGLSIQLSVMENARDSYQTAATILSRQGNFKQAMEAVRQALEIDPFHVNALKLLFKLSLEMHDYEVLSQALERAVQKDPANLQLKEMLGQSCMFQGNLARAKTLFEDIFRADDGRFVLLCDLAETAVRMRNLDFAIEVFDRVMNKLLAKRDNARIMEFFRIVFEQNPKHLGALERMADFYQKISDNYNYILTLEKLVNVLVERQDYKRALGSLETLLSYEPKNDKFQKLHKQIFQQMYPDEPYSPFGVQEEEDMELPGASVFEIDTADLSAGRAFAGKKESDAAIEIELLMSYGLRDKAKSKILERIKEDPGDYAFREKLKDLYKEEGNLKAAASVCFELVNVYTLNGEHEKAAAYEEEGRSLDPSRRDLDLPTGLLSGKLHIPSDSELAQTSMDLMDFDEESIDLSDDLSDILVGDDLTGEIRMPPAKAQQAPPAGRASISAQQEDELQILEYFAEEPEEVKMISLDEDEVELKEVVPLPRRQPEAPVVPSPPPIVEVPRPAAPPKPTVKTEAPVVEVFQPPPPAPPKAPPRAAAPPRAEASPTPVSSKPASLEMDTDINLRLEQTLKSLGDIGIDPSFFSWGSAPAPSSKPESVPSAEHEADAQALMSMLTQPESYAPELSEPGPRVVPLNLVDIAVPPSLDPSSQTAQLTVQDIDGAIQEIDFYLKLGFIDNAKEELARLNRRFPGNPDVLSRMKELGITPKSEAPAPSKKRPVEAAPAPKPVRQPEPQPVSLAKSPEPAGELEEEELLQDISPDEVSIDLFNFISTEPYAEDTKRPLASAEARKISPDFSIVETDRADKPEMQVSINVFEGIGNDEIDENLDIFDESKSFNAKPAERYKTGPLVKEERIPIPAPPAGVSMQNLFADLVEEANKVFVASNEEEGDFETHYNLGIAYKEMGLLDDAIGEFQKSYNLVKDESRSSTFVQACNMLSLCFFEKGIFKSAIKWCERGLESPGHQEHEYLALKYDMMNAYEKIGDYVKAIELCNEIYEVNINYRDVAERLRNLKKMNG